MMTEKITTREQGSELQWQIVQNRNREFDNLFFFDVSSTGIYCKPSCAARRPKPENTLFFDTCAEVENAGFRACLRCRPQAENTRRANAELVIQTCKLIENNFDEEISLEFLAAELNVSPSHLQRTFKQTLGVSPKEFADTRHGLIISKNRFGNRM